MLLETIFNATCFYFGVFTFNITILFTYFSVRPLFTVYPEPIDATEPQKPVVFKCKAKGTPAPVIKWYKDGLLILGTPEESRFHITIEGSLVFMGKRYHITREGSLVIFDPRVEDEGTYKCEAENALGKVSYEVSLYVEMSEFFFLLHNLCIIIRLKSSFNIR